MDNSFKINVCFDENGQNVEKLIADFLINSKNNNIIKNSKQDLK